MKKPIKVRVVNGNDPDLSQKSALRLKRLLDKLDSDPPIKVTSKQGPPLGEDQLVAALKRLVAIGHRVEAEEEAEKKRKRKAPRK